MMKKVIGILILSLLYLASCNNDDDVNDIEIEIDVEEEEEEEEVVVECHVDLTTVGEIMEECFEHTIIEEEFTVFRGKKLIDLSTEDYGEIDITVSIEDRSYGIAGPERGDIYLIPQNTNIEIAEVYVAYEYCYRYMFSAAGPEPDPFYMFVDSYPCDLYTEEELNNVDTVRVVDYSDFVVRSFDEGEEIQGVTEWASDSILIKHLPYKRGEFGHNTPKYVLFRVLEEETIRYGWIQISFENIYGIGGEIISSGITQ